MRTMRNQVTRYREREQVAASLALHRRELARQDSENRATAKAVRAAPDPERTAALQLVAAGELLTPEQWMVVLEHVDELRAFNAAGLGYLAAGRAAAVAHHLLQVEKDIEQLPRSTVPLPLPKPPDGRYPPPYRYPTPR
jgi:hypothetical protein